MNWLKLAMTFDMSGPIVDTIISTVQMMFDRGAPTIFDDMGFNKNDYNSPIMQELRVLYPGSTVSSQKLLYATQALMKYQRRQIPNAQVIRQTFEEEYQKQRTQHAPEQSQQPAQAIEEGGTHVVQVIGQGDYGKTKVFIPEITFRITPNLVNKHLRIKAEELGWQTEFNAYGKEAYPLWKAYGRSKTEPNVVEIKPQFMQALSNALEEYNTKAKAISKRKGVPLAFYDTSALQGQHEIKKIVTGTMTPTQYGNEYIIKFNLPDNWREFLNQFNDYVKNTLEAWWPKFRKETKDYLLKNVSDEKFPALIEWFKDKGYNTGDLDNLAVEIAAQSKQQQEEQNTPTPVAQGYVLAASLAEGTPYHMALGVPQWESGMGPIFFEIIKFSFPVYRGKDEGQRLYDKNNRTYYIKGSYADYADFGNLAKQKGFDVSQLRTIFGQLLQTGEIQIERLDGTLDGYASREEFNQDIENNTAGDMSLYDAQKTGVEFLYGRQSALMGDETGAGKCQSGDTRVIVNDRLCDLKQIWDTYAHRITQTGENEEWAWIDDNLYIHSVDNNGKITKSNISSLYRQKINEKIRRITTSNGKVLKCTYAHKFLTPEGWKNKLKVGNYICSSSNLFKMESSTDMSESLAFMLGWQIAEGDESNSRATLRISQKDDRVLKEWINHFNAIADDIPGLRTSPKVIPAKNGKTPYMILNSKAYKTYLETIGHEWGHKSKDKIIPDIIMRASNNAVRICLRALFDAEACCSKTSRRIEFSSASKTLIYQVSALLGRFNILNTFSKEQMKSATNGTGIKRPYYRLYIIGSGVQKFITNIGFSVTYKNDNFNKQTTYANPNKEGKPLCHIVGNFFRKYNLPFRHVNIGNTKYITGQRKASNNEIDNIIAGFKSIQNGEALKKYSEFPRSKWTDRTIAVYEKIDNTEINEIVEQLRLLKNNDLQYETITNIEEIHWDDYVYDLTIDDYHNYVAENVICHNTAQAAIAAQLRMNQSGGITAVVTLKTTQLQWAREIEKFTGESNIYIPDTNAKFDPQKASQAKFIVLTYPMFSRNGKRITDSLKQMNIDVMVLDECHHVKNESKRTKNLLDLGENVPFKWGLSATISANRPIDVWRQLKSVGHRLGNLSEGVFRKNFAGQEYVPNHWGGTWENKNENSAMEAAMLLRSWLTDNSGVYTRRTKKEMNPNLPNHLVDTIATPLSDAATNKLDKAISERMAQYKDPDLAISQMIAERTELAKAKVPLSLEWIDNILAQDKKVIVFTCFVESAQDLEAGSQKLVDKYGGGNVVTIIGGDKGRDAKIETFKNDPNTKVMVLSVLTGGTGLDVPNVVDDVIMNDYSWTPKDAEQAEGRAFRVSSENDVTTRYIVAANTVDEDFFDKVQEKRKLAAIIDHPKSLDELKKANARLKQINQEMLQEAAKRSKKRQANASWLLRIT